MHKLLSEENIKKTIDIIYFFIIGLIFCIGIYLRTSLYLRGMPLWWDEMTLAQSVLRENIWLSFTELEEMQKCPPLFVFFSHINTNIF